jgi:stalled ribosome rescue protein Dom34
MSPFVIWLDSENAHLFNLSGETVVKTHFEKKIHDHHTHQLSNHTGDPSIGHFFNEVSSHLSGAEEILLVGPGLAKDHFKAYLLKHHEESLAKKIVGTETCDHPTDNQILALAKKFFKRYKKLI